MLLHRVEWPYWRDFIVCTNEDVLCLEQTHLFIPFLLFAEVNIMINIINTIVVLYSALKGFIYLQV